MKTFIPEHNETEEAVGNFFTGLITAAIIIVIAL